MPWTDEAARRAGTVHAIGSFEEIVAAEREVNRGRMPERPFVLVGQQYLADPSPLAGRRAPGLGLRPRPQRLSTATPTEAMLDQIERFAPGLRERIVARATRSPAELAADNANYVGGDIITGANTPLQTLIRPRLAARPLRDRHPRRLHLLGGDPARRRGARDVRLQRRPGSASLDLSVDAQPTSSSRRRSRKLRSASEWTSSRARS